MWLLCGKGFERKAIENERNRELELIRMRRRKGCAHLEKFMPMAFPKFPLRCSLEELYVGATKRMKLFQDIHNGFGNAIDHPHLEDIIVKLPPGLSHGDPVFFPRTRDTQTGIIPLDVILVVQEEPHPMFKRIGYDLWMTKKMTLVEALTKDIVTVKLLDKRTLTIKKPKQLAAPPIMIVNEGMLIHNLGIKGSLFVEFDVVLPTDFSLTDE